MTGTAILVAMTSTETPRVLLTRPGDLLGAIPYLLGFHPADCLVITGFTGRPRGGRLRLTIRVDLPAPPGSLGGHVPLLRREGVAQVVLAGFGPGPLITPAVDRLIGLVRAGGIECLDALRAHEGRYWSYLCTRTDCCPAEGVPYDAASGPVAAAAAAAGLVALPDRASLERSLAPRGGPGRAAMRQATARVVAGVRGALTGEPDGEHVAAFVAAGLDRLRRAVATYARGARLADSEAARLGLDLAVIRVRDEAWVLIDDAGLDAHLALWKDLTRRLEPRFVPPAAALLGAAAWRAGDCALAGLAVERALAIDPAYSMARLLREGLRHVLSPDALRARMPTTAELDDAMGPPALSWLAPLTALLDDPGDRPGHAASVPSGPATPAAGQPRGSSALRRRSL